MYATANGQSFEDLRDAHDASSKGDVISFNGEPFVRVTSKTRLDFVLPAETVEA